MVCFLTAKRNPSRVPEPPGQDDTKPVAQKRVTSRDERAGEAGTLGPGSAHSRPLI